MLGDHLGGVLNGVARLLIGARLLEDMGREHVAHILWPVRQQTLDGTAAGVGVADAIALDREAPGLIKGVLAVRGILDVPCRLE